MNEGGSRRCLLQLVRDLGEGADQVRADRGHSRDGGDCDQCCNEAVLDRSCARFVRTEALKQGCHRWYPVRLNLSNLGDGELMLGCTQFALLARKVDKSEIGTKARPVSRALTVRRPL